MKIEFKVVEPKPALVGIHDVPIGRAFVNWQGQKLIRLDLDSSLRDDGRVFRRGELSVEPAYTVLPVDTTVTITT